MRSSSAPAVHRAEFPTRQAVPTWWGHLAAWADRHRQLIDGLLAVTLAASWWRELAGTPGPSPWSYVLAAGATLPVAVRRVRPVPAFAASAVSLAALLLFADTTGATAVGVAFVGYSIIVSSGSSAVVPVLVVGASLEALSWWRLDAVTSQSVVLDLLLLAAVVVVAEATRTRRLNVALLAERAERERLDRDVATQRAVADERASIARDLHDIVAHCVSQISVQAGTGRMLAAQQPGTAATALATIEELSRDALREMRRLMGVLRDGHEAAVHPGEGLSSLDRLVQNATRAGVDTELRIEGPARLLPASVDRAIYRITQEALTNAIKHAAPATAVVHVTYTIDAVDLTISNTSQRPSTMVTPHGRGYGIIGMTERARTLGGSLVTRPTDAGFSVEATLPTGHRS